MKLFNKFAIAAASAVLSLSIAGINEAQAAVFTNPDNGHKYLLTETKGTWTEAQQQAVNAGGNLVTINDSAEQNWLQSVFGSMGTLWIGLTDTAQEGNFEWVSGQNLTYTNWFAGEPNNSTNGGRSPGGENYTAMYGGRGGGWNDLPNAGPGFSATKGIIEIESVPEPASILGLIAVGAFGTVSTIKQKKKQIV